MADLARSAVTFNDEWSEGRNRRFFFRDLTLNLTGQGGNTNKILASVLGFAKLTVVEFAVKTDDTVVYGCSPSNDGSKLLLTVSGAPGTPADVTATVRAVVGGIAA
jgi:hypothetical protein